jgi:DNA repair exonuclease SbcCD ATPase subunit
MKLTLKDMNGLLNGKCLPSDLIVGETLAEYLVRKFAELDQKLAESQREFRAADATIENLQMQVEKLAAENAGLKAAINEHSEGFTVCPCCGTEHDSCHDDVCRALNETPATDAFLAEVRAQGVEMCSSEIQKQIWDEREGDGIAAAIDAMEIYASQLRKGDHS